MGSYMLANSSAAKLRFPELVVSCLLDKLLFVE